MAASPRVTSAQSVAAHAAHHQVSITTGASDKQLSSRKTVTTSDRGKIERNTRELMCYSKSPLSYLLYSTEELETTLNKVFGLPLIILLPIPRLITVPDIPIMGLILGICSQTRVIHQRLSEPIPSPCSDSMMFPFKGLRKGSALPRHSVISMNDEGGSRDLRHQPSRVATYRCRCRCIVLFMVSGL